MPNLIQLFTCRNFLPWEGVLDQIAAAGFDGVEGFGPCYEDAAGFRAMLDARGLSMPQGHVQLADLEADLGAVLAYAKTLGMRRLIVPWLPPDQRPLTVAGWVEIGRRLDAVGRRVIAAGFDFAYHNHDFELRPIDGVYPMDVLLETAPGMGWEPDLGWVTVAGLDPLTELTRRSARVVTCHLKDVQPDFARDKAEGGWADLGHGVIDWGPVLARLGTLPRVESWVFEHDNPSDLRRFLTRTKASIDRFGQTVAAGN